MKNFIALATLPLLLFTSSCKKKENNIVLEPQICKVNKFEESTWKGYQDKFVTTIESVNDYFNNNPKYKFLFSHTINSTVMPGLQSGPTSNSTFALCITKYNNCEPKRETGGNLGSLFFETGPFSEIDSVLIDLRHQDFGRVQGTEEGLVLIVFWDREALNIIPERTKFGVTAAGETGYVFERYIPVILRDEY